MSTIIIEYWDDIYGNSPIEEFLNDLPSRDSRLIIDKNELYSEYGTIPKLKNSKFLRDVKGAAIELWELRYLISPPYRALCIVRDNTIIILVMFQGSGTNKKAMRSAMKFAIERALDWNRRHSNNNLINNLKSCA